MGQYGIKTPLIKKIIDQHQDWSSEKYHYKFEDAIEQTLAFFIQAACENQAGKPRKLEDWGIWEKTFEHAEVLSFAKTLWDDWLKYLKKTDEYRRIDDWILKMLKKHYDKPNKNNF